MEATLTPGADAVSTPGSEIQDSAHAGPELHRPLGATILADARTQFRVWAPKHETLELHIVAPQDRRVAMTRTPAGYHEVTLDDAPAGTRYFFSIDGNDRPDPASRFQPDGVHKASQVVAKDFAWNDRGWNGLPLEELVIYELHIGTFTPGGTFDSAIEKLDTLVDLGVTAIELLPVAQFPGGRNWGYDGVYVGAVQNTYGGPEGMKRLVDAAHQRGLAVILDVVYNHLGPEGNYLGEYGPYFTDKYKTPWGLALNFDGAQSDHVRWYFIHSALQFIDEFHVDGLRVDAVHAIVDHSAEPFLQDLTTAVRERANELGRRVWTIAESDLNDPRVITPREGFGLGFDSQWCDDFHHSLHTLLTGEQMGYYEGFGKASDLARVMTQGYLFTGQHSTYRGRKYGLSANTDDGRKFVVCAQNHDQVGNRMLGDRLSTIVPYDKLKLSAVAVVLSPFIPMLWMGEEYGEKAPWQYFTSHSDPELIEAVRKGRAEEFDDFAWQGEAPDPHDEETFNRSKLDWSQLEREEHALLRRLYKELLMLRKETPSLRKLDLSNVRTHADDEKQVVLIMRGEILIGLNFSEKTQIVPLPFEAGGWKAIIDGSKIENGNIILPPASFALYRGE